MPKFSEGSFAQLRSCDVRLQNLFRKVIETTDCRILEGHRDKAKQTRAFEMGKSKTPWPQSKHNSMPSLAVDVAPYPVVYYQSKGDKIRSHWKAIARWYLFAGIVRGVAEMMEIPIRWGGLWKRSPTLWIWENGFDDLGHFEILEAPAPASEGPGQKSLQEV